MEPFFDYDYGGPFGGSDIVSALGVFIGVVVIILMVCWIASIVLYILRSIGLYRLAVNRGMSGAGLAWIPLVGFYRIGSIADDISARNGSKTYYRYFLLIGGIVNTLGGAVSGLFSAVLNGSWFSRFYDDPRYYSDYESGLGSSFAYLGSSMIVSLISLAVFVLTIIALNIIYKAYRPMSSTSWTVLSVIFSFMQSIFLFVIRNAVPASELGMQGYYPQQNQGWQPPYPPYGPQPSADGYYPPQYMPPPEQPMGDAYRPSIEPDVQPPAAPEPPEPWEADSSLQPPQSPPWEKNGDDLS